MGKGVSRDGRRFRQGSREIHTTQGVVAEGGAEHSSLCRSGKSNRKKELIPTDGKNVKTEASISTAIFAVCVVSAVGAFVIAAVTSIVYRIYLTFFEKDSWLIERKINRSQDEFELVLFACLALVGIGVIPLATSYAYKGIKKRFEEARKNGQ